MIKSFLNGIGFGFGFCLAVAVVAWAVSQFGDPIGKRIIHSSSELEIGYEEKNKWNDLTIEEKINKTSAIAIIRFRKEADNLNAAYVEDIVRRDPNSKLSIKLGDRLEKSDFYSQGGIGRDRNGVVIFYVRNPGVEIGQSYLYDDRMVGEGDMPLELFMRKFKEAS